MLFIWVYFGGVFRIKKAFIHAFHAKFNMNSFYECESVCNKCLCMFIIFSTVSNYFRIVSLINLNAFCTALGKQNELFCKY